MTQTNTVVRSISIPVPVAAAFNAFTEDISRWWPREFTFGEDNFVSAGFDTRAGGHWYEVDRDGRRTAWGDILVWEPPQRLLVTWQISPQRTPEPDTDHASLIEVAFVADGPQATRVEITHSAFERHGDGADTMQAGMASEQGWSGLLARFAESLD